MRRAGASFLGANRRIDCKPDNVRERMTRLKDVEIRIVAELMKNSRRSDREIARAVGVSQPTVSRIIQKLENEGVIREYAMIPDFAKLGYSIMGATTLDVQVSRPEINFQEIRKTTTEIEQSSTPASLLAINALGGNKNRLFIAFYNDYAEYAEAMNLTKQIPHVRVDSVESLLADLNDKSSYRILSMSAIANHLLKRLGNGKAKKLIK